MKISSTWLFRAFLLVVFSAFGTKAFAQDPLTEATEEKSELRDEKVLIDQKKSEDAATAAPDEYTLDPVVAEGTPIEALKYDAILPAQRKSFSNKGANGAITKELQNSLPFHFAENAKPGSASTVSGSVRGAEEIDVNVLGVPLNFPQGGGFYLQSLPQYLWSGYSFQFGPSMGAFDPRGVTGSLSLRLWSSEALNSGQNLVEAGALHSTADLQQFYAGASTGGRFAGRVGYSTGEIKGPAGSISTRVLDHERIAVKLHVIASQQEIPAFQSERSNSDTAKYVSARGIPVLQVDAKVGEGWLLKNSLFYDNTYLKTDDPTNPARDAIKVERSHVYQGGVESALIGKDLRIGFGARQTDFHRLAFAVPTERLVNVQATYTFHPADSFKLEPTVGGTAVSRFGFNPMATLGARYDFKESGAGLFSRVGVHNRVPSLLDRFYSVTQGGGVYVAPNPDLGIERVYSAEAGLDHQDSKQNAAITFFARYSKDARYYRNYVLGPFGQPISPAQLINNGDAYTFGIWQTYDRELLPTLSLGTRGAFTRARFKTAKTPYLYQPELVGILVADVHDADRFVSFEVANRTSSSYFGGSESSTQNVTLPGYNYTDLTLTVRPTPVISLMASVENVFDRQIEFRLNQRADVGRYYVFSANAQF